MDLLLQLDLPSPSAALSPRPLRLQPLVPSTGTPRSAFESDSADCSGSDDESSDSDCSDCYSDGASSRCASPDFASDPRFAVSSSFHASSSSAAAAAAAAASASSFDPLPRFGGLAVASPLRVAKASPSASPLFPRRAASLAPGTVVHRAAVAPAAVVVEASVITGELVPAVVAHGLVGRPVVAARLPESETASVSSDDTRGAGRARLNSIASTASVPCSPTSGAVLATAWGDAGASVLGKRRCGRDGEPESKRYRNAPVAGGVGAAAAPASKAEQLYLMERAPSAVSVGSHSFVVASRRGGVTDTVTVAMHPSCTCAAFQAGDLCPHMRFVFRRVLRAPENSPALQRRTLTLAELSALFEAAPKNPAVEVARGKDARDLDGRGVVSREATGARACAVCCEDFDGAAELTFCRTGCGINFHARCHERWNRHAAAAAGKRATPHADACPVCRASWAGDEDLKSPVSLALNRFAQAPPLFDLGHDDELMLGM